MWRMPANIGWKAYAQADRYDPSRMKDHISSMFSLKRPDSNGRKMLGGTDGSRTDEGCLVELKDCDRYNDSCELSGGKGETPELVNDCVESGVNESMNSVILDKSKSCRGNGELHGWGEVAKDVDRSGV